MIKVDINIAKKNIEEVVEGIGFKKTNYVFLRDKLITQKMMVYDEYKIVTFFVRVKKGDNKLKLYCHKKCRFVGTSNLFYELIVSRIKMEEYKVEQFENIEYLSNDNKLLFTDMCGKHKFNIAETNIYGFDQFKQIKKLKDYVYKIHSRLCIIGK